MSAETMGKVEVRTASRAERARLRKLAEACGVQTTYFDMVAGRRRAARTSALRAVLRALGVASESPAEVAESERMLRLAAWQRLCEPVVVAWGGRRLNVLLRLEAAAGDSTADGELLLEGGERRTWRLDLSAAPARAWAECEGRRFVSKRVELPFTTARGRRARLPYGYHRLAIEAGGERAEAMIIAAPSKAFTGEKDEGKAEREPWGIFAPLYALHSEKSWGVGDFSELERMVDWVGELGGQFVGTLPLLACFLNQPFEPSPYVPVSRRFWNELFIAIPRLPEWKSCPAARELVESNAFAEEINQLRGALLVDYRGAMAVKRRVLELLSQQLWNSSGERRAEFEAYRAAHPVLEDYARFRGACARQQQVWHLWPERQRDGQLEAGDWDETERRYHLAAQWWAHQQLDEFARSGRKQGVSLYLDLPLGVHPDGYDVWREREAFAGGVSGGAPPDSFFVHGQDWGFPPPHPERIREQGYRYFIGCVRHHLEYARLLRIDHVMGLHRLFWVPHGMEATAGVYVRYRAEELYAILALESWRHKAVLIGEDLGTVPRYVRPMMHRRGIQRMYVAQFEIVANPDEALRPMYPEALAGVNTHDTPTFGGFWKGVDIREAVSLELMDEAAAQRELELRRRNCAALAEYLRRAGWSGEDSGEECLAALRGLLRWMGASPARVVIAALEDLWGETEQQNTPGTHFERPNWRRKFRYAVEQLRGLTEVRGALQGLAESRRRTP